MKRITVLGLLAVLAISGCQVKEEGELAPEGKTFTATMEAMADDATGVDTKTSMDSYGNVLWKKGDQVSTFVASTINQHFQVTDASDGKTAAALNQVESSGFVAGGDIPNNVAYYPYVATAAIAKRSGGAYLISDISLPATQNYAESSFGNGAFPMTAVTSSTNDYNLKFKNVLGGLKLQLKGNATITSISVTGNNNEKLCGAVEVTVSAADTPAIALTDATATTVTLDCGDGVQLDVETATAFIIALPPMTMTGGFTVTVTDSQGKEMEIKTTKSQTISRSNLLSMPAVNYIGIPIEPQYVDLGLPSRLKWAAYNLCQNGFVNSPEEFGDFYAWGETEPYYSRYSFYSAYEAEWKEGKSEGYTWASYKWCSGTSDKLTKYDTNMGYPRTWAGEGDPDMKVVLDPDDDAAHVILGGNWRIPTYEEWIELYNYCDWESEGAGLRITSQINGNSIFLPQGGRYINTTRYSNGTYWSSSLCDWSEAARAVNIGSLLYYGEGLSRCSGAVIRPVNDQGIHINMETVSLSESSLSLSVGESAKLTATVTPSNTTQHLIFTSSNSSVAEVDVTRKVTAVGVGTATITAQTIDGSVSATCVITVSEMTLSTGEYIDMGLPSRLKWASCNLCENGFVETPEEYGDYYAWGETEPYYMEGHSQDNPCNSWKDGKSAGYNDESYQWFQFDGSNYHITKYDKGADNKTVLEAKDDAAYVKLGGSWRVPTYAEWTELIENSTWIWFTLNGVSGCLITSNINGNNIFLPAAGQRRDTGIEDFGSRGCYCSSSVGILNSWNTMALGFISYRTRGSCDESYGRHIGRSVRPVTE